MLCLSEIKQKLFDCQNFSGNDLIVKTWLEQKWFDCHNSKGNASKNDWNDENLSKMIWLSKFERKSFNLKFWAIIIGPS